MPKLCLVIFALIGFVFFAPDAKGELPDLTAWKTVLSFRPPADVQKKVRDLGPGNAIHRIEETDSVDAALQNLDSAIAQRKLNLDRHTVKIGKLPVIDGAQVTAPELLKYVRLHLDLFVDPAKGKFSPVDAGSATAWASDSFSGAVMMIDLGLLGMNPDDGAVVATKTSSQEWIFSTIRNGSMWGSASQGTAVSHPLSGNRAFGISKVPSGDWLFYNIAADRPTRQIDAIADMFGNVQSLQKQMWSDSQKRLVDFINANQGTAEVGSSVTHCLPWNEVRDSQYYDTTGQPSWQ